MNVFDAQLEFYTNEHTPDPALKCFECGNPAEGEVSVLNRPVNGEWVESCNSCHAKATA